MAVSSLFEGNCRRFEGIIYRFQTNRLLASVTIYFNFASKSVKTLREDMIQAFRAENFRCFKEIEANGLRRVNVIVGRNGAGKTAFLEAMRLGLSGTPQALWGMNQARTVLVGFQQPFTRENFESLWSTYFFNFDSSRPIKIKCVDSKGFEATLAVYYDMNRPAPGPPAPSRPDAPITPVTVNFIPSLAFERHGFAGEQSILYASVNAQGLNFDNGVELLPVTESFGSPFNTNFAASAQMFSQLSIREREGEIVSVVRQEFEPNLESLVVLSLGVMPGLYASVKYLKEKVPIGLMSSGMNRFITMLSAILLRGNGVVLLDEIENGLSYRVFPALWKYILKFAQENNTQVFASTHSNECLKALLPTIENNEEEFAAIRSERVNGSCEITVLPGRAIEAAIDQGVEIR